MRDVLPGETMSFSFGDTPSEKAVVPPYLAIQTWTGRIARKLDSGPRLAEYALILGLVALVVIVSLLR
jgi:hypothetical protein